MSSITFFAKRFLDGKELELGFYLSTILCNPKCNLAGILVSQILPMYWEKRGDTSYTLEPDPIYRPLYYVEMYANGRDFKENTRIFLDNAAGHIEGCLLWLTKTPPRFRGSPKPFGGLVYELFREGILEKELAEQLLAFNKLFNIPAKHMTAYYRPRSRLDERTFSCLDAALGLMVMRKLSIELFKILTERGISLPQSWPDFDDDWLSPIWGTIESEEEDDNDETEQDEDN